MADYSEYNSAGGLFSFSKGPKSLYEPDGATDHFIIDSGVVFNVPQTDEDDEWGGTERIAQERVADAVARLEYYVADPVGAGVNGLVYKVAQLKTFLDTNSSSLTLGNIQINVVTDKITIGTTETELSLTTLKLNTNFSAVVSTDSTLIAHSTSSIALFDDGVSTKRVDITANGGIYRFESTQLTCPTGTYLELSGGTLHAGTIIGDISVSATEISTPLLWASTINSNTAINATGTINVGNTTLNASNSNIIVGGALMAWGSVNDIGVAGYNYFRDAFFLGTVYSANFYASAAVTCASLSVSGAGALGSLTVSGAISSATLTTSGNLVATGDISSSGGWVDFTTGANVQGITFIQPETKVWYKKIGKKVIVDFNLLGQANPVTSLSFTLPFPVRSVQPPSVYKLAQPIQAQQVGVSDLGMAYSTGGSSSLNLYTTWDSGSWSVNPAYAKGAVGTFIYEIDITS